MTTMEVTGLNDQDTKTAKGWKKNFSVTMTGVMGTVTMTLTLKSQDRDALEEIVPMDKKAQKSITLGPVNQTLGAYPGAPGQSAIVPDETELDEEDQDEQLRQIRKDLADAKDKGGE